MSTQSSIEEIKTTDLAARSDLHIARKLWHILTGLTGLYAYYTLGLGVDFFIYATMGIGVLWASR